MFLLLLRARWMGRCRLRLSLLTPLAGKVFLKSHLPCPVHLPRPRPKKVPTESVEFACLFRFVSSFMSSLADLGIG